MSLIAELMNGKLAVRAELRIRRRLGADCRPGRQRMAAWHRSLDLNARGMQRLMEGGDCPWCPYRKPIFVACCRWSVANRSRAKLSSQSAIAARRDYPADGIMGLPQCVRISTGTDEDLELLFEALKKVGRRTTLPTESPVK
jgi:hypothetical protein